MIKFTRNDPYIFVGWVIALGIAYWISTLIIPIQSPDEGSHIARAFMISNGQWKLSRELVAEKEWRLADWNGSVSEPLLDFFCSNKSNVDQIREVVERGGSKDASVLNFFARTAEEQIIEREKICAPRMREKNLHANSGGAVDAGLQAFFDVYGEYVANPTNHVRPESHTKAASIQWSGTMTFWPVPGTGYYNPLIYLPHAAGIYIGRRLHWSVLESYHLARFTTLLATSLLLLCALRVWTPNPLACALLLLPMSVFQFVTPSIDCLTNAIAALVLSLFVRYSDLSHELSIRQSLLLAALLFLLCSVRVHLAPLLAIPFVLAWQRKEKRNLVLGIVAVVAVVAWTLFAIRATVDVRTPKPLPTTALLLYYIRDPLLFFQLVAKTLTDPDWSNMYQLSFIGILGALDTHLPKFFHPILWIGLGVCGLLSFSIRTIKSDWLVRLTLIFGAVIAILLTFFAILINWTPHPASLIIGVQGRYFLVPALMVAYAMSGMGNPFSEGRKTLSIVGITAFASVSFRRCV